MIHLLIAIGAFLWSGMIIGISFFESWVKFKTPGLNKIVGLQVGRTVFFYFQRVQIIWLILLIILIGLTRASWVEFFFSGILILILSLQVCWIFPILSQRVAMLANGEKLPQTYSHNLYGIGEVIKFFILLSLGVMNLLL